MLPPLSERPASASNELRELLRRSSPFGSLGGETLDHLADACEVIDVPGGTQLVRAGDTLDCMLGVLHGGLRVVRHTADGVEATIREFRRGEIIGVLGLLVARPFPVEIVAVRDCMLLRLSRERFLSLAASHPELLRALARLMSERAFEVLEEVAAPRRDRRAPPAGNLAVLPWSLDPSVCKAKDELIELALRDGDVTHVTAEDVDAALGAGAAAGEHARGRVTAWLSNLERVGNVLLYECDPQRQRWTDRCRRQSDALVIVAAETDAPRVDEIASKLAAERPGGLSRPNDVVLVHPASTRVPSGTSAWARLPDLRAIHHVRTGNREDLARVVRRLMGRPTGLVLSGGGARGIAHVGVIAAIVEADIPIDLVCGTSMGAIFAAGLALGFDIPRMRAELKQLFGRPFSLYDLTLPVSSLLAGKKLDRVLHQQFGDANIEDLWIPFFCVSTDLARARLIVHDRGPLWKSVRASCSIPGIFPPLPMDGCTLVDGGLVDNLPLDLLLERCSGPIIASDVFPYGDPSFERPSGRIAGLLRGLRTKLRGEPASPPLFDILVRSTLVGSKVRQQSAMTHADDVVYLEPPVATVGALQWRSHEALFVAGYQYARERLTRGRSLFPHG